MSRTVRGAWWCILLGICAYFVSLVHRVASESAETVALQAMAVSHRAQHGFVLAAGSERVEVTSLLWVWVSSNVSTVFSLSTLSTLFALFALVLVAHWRRISDGAPPSFFGLVPVALIALQRPFAQQVGAGLEHGVFALCTLWLCGAFASEERDAEKTPHSGWLLALCIAVRAEAVVFVAGFFVAKFIRRAATGPRRQDYTWLLVTTLTITAVTLFRLAYFAQAIPSYGLFAANFRPHIGGTSQRIASIFAVFSTASFGWLLLASPIARVPSSRLGPVLSMLFAVALPLAFSDSVTAARDWLVGLIPLATLLLIDGLRGFHRVAQSLVPKASRKALALGASLVFAAVMLGAIHSRRALGLPDQRARPLDLTASQWLLADPNGSLRTDTIPTDQARAPLALWRLSLTQNSANESANPVWIIAHTPQRRPTGYLQLLRTADPGAVFLSRESFAAPFNGDFAGQDQQQGLAIAVSEPEADPRTPLHIVIGMSATLGRAIGQLELIDPSATSRPIRLLLRESFRDGSLVFPSGFQPSSAERFLFRATIILPSEGTYFLRWRSENPPVVVERTLIARAGLSATTTQRAAIDLDRALVAGDARGASQIAARLSTLSDASLGAPFARLALRRFGTQYVDRARIVADAGALGIATALGQYVLSLTHEPALVAPIAERLLDAAEVARRSDRLAASRLAQAALSLDPRKSWARTLIQPRTNFSDATYQTVVNALERPDREEALNRAIEALGTNGQWREAAQLAEQRQFTPHVSRVRVIVARGLLSQGRVRDALRMVSGVPCAEAHDREVTLALRALLEEQQNGYRPNDPRCLDD